jgi:HD-GYP domain-containing protein (c-di-GMP phosphodiesterase class II)
MAKPRIDLRALNDNSRRFVYRLSTLIRTAHIHAMHNQAMDYSLQVAASSATRLVDDLGDLMLLGEEDTVHLNDFRIKVSRSMITSINHFNTFLHERGLGGFEVKGATEKADWQSVIDVLMSAPEVADGMDNSPSLNLHLSESGVENVRFAPPMKLRKGALGATAGGEGRSVQIAAARSIQLYVRALRAVDNVYRGANRSRVALSRIIQYLVEHAVDEPRAHLALLSLKEEDVSYRVQHPVNRAILAVALGHRIGLNRSALLDLGLCALTCDLGMVGLPDDLLEKAGPLDPVERAAMEKHPLTSTLQVLAGGRLDTSTRRRVLANFEHHLGFDMGGYPHVLAWDSLHLFSRIIAVCETYDAMTTTTPWRMGLLPDEALAQLVELAGGQLDPALVSALVNMVGRFPLGSAVLLDTGEVGVVYLNHPDPRDHLRPVLRLVLDADGEPIRTPVILDLRERVPGGDFARSAVKLVKPEDLGIDARRAVFS